MRSVSKSLSRIYYMYLLSIQTRQQLRFHSVSRSPDVRSRYFTKEGNAFLSFVWNAFWNAFGTQMERVRNASWTRSERKWNANACVMLFLSSTVSHDNLKRCYIIYTNVYCYYISHNLPDHIYCILTCFSTSFTINL